MRANNPWMCRREFLKGLQRAPLALALGLLSGCAKRYLEVEDEPIPTNGLAVLINHYRRQNGLPEIPISRSLTTVAQKHVADLNNHHPQRACGERGNFHSWSNNGKWLGIAGEGAWKGCCYPDDHSKRHCMWDKPKEIANYPGNGYEIVHWKTSVATPQSALKSWKNSRAHRAVILNSGEWSDIQWKALGAACRGKYASAWFGEVKG